MNLVKEKEENKKKIILSVIVAMTCVLAGTTLILIAGLLEMPVAIRIVLVIIASVVMIAGVIVAAALDQEAGYYECPICHARFVPSMSAYVKGAHTITKRRLKCPECGKISMCKHRLTR